VTVALQLNDPITGTWVGQQVLESLAPQSQAVLTLTWHVTDTLPGRYAVYVVADPGDRILEATEENNSAGIEVGLLPDLALYASGVATGTLPSGERVVSAWVYNQGVRDAHEAVLGVYDGWPTPGKTPLISATLNIGAGQHRVATLNLGDYPLPGFYLAVDTAGQVADRDRSDNILPVGKQLPQRLYLPLIMQKQ
jgi:hypothetical protein